MQYPARAPRRQRSSSRVGLAALASVLCACVGDVVLDDLAPPPGVDQGGSAPAQADAGSPRDAASAAGPDAGALAYSDSGPASSPPSPADAQGSTPDAQPSASDASAPDTGVDAAIPSSPDVPDSAACADARSWPADAAQWEREVLELTNQARAAGHNCDSEGNFGPTTPLTMEPHLRCSARLHSAYMARTGDFNHTQTATGLDPFERIAATGYRAGGAGENIAAGQTSPRAVVDGWLASDGHCRNIMDPNFRELGVGYALASSGQLRHYWTQNFGHAL